VKPQRTDLFYVINTVAVEVIVMPMRVTARKLRDQFSGAFQAWIVHPGVDLQDPYQLMVAEEAKDLIRRIQVLIDKGVSREALNTLARHAAEVLQMMGAE
jgi:hypothetical protein